MKNLSFSLKYLHYVTGVREAAPLRISGVGLREVMSPGRVERPAGTRDRFLVLFHTPIELFRRGAWESYPAGTGMLWPDGAGHFYGNCDENWTHTWLHFHGTEAERLLREIGLVEDEVFHFSDSGEMERSLEKIYHEVTRSDASNRIVLPLFEVLLQELKREISHPAAGFVPETLRHLKIRLDAAAAIPWSVEELARMSGYSVSHFSALFRRYFGVAPGEYCRELRLRRAAYELLNWNFSVSEVAQSCGFPSLGRFSRVFREHFGMAPSQWRKLHGPGSSF